MVDLALPAERPRRHGGLTVLAWTIVILFLLPILTVAAQFFLPDQGTWAHLAATLLPEYLENTAGWSWAWGCWCRSWAPARPTSPRTAASPAAACCVWALLLPMAMPAYVMGYAYTDCFDVAGPVQTALREAIGLAAATTGSPRSAPWAAPR